MPRVRPTAPLSWSLLFSVLIIGSVTSLCLAPDLSPFNAMSYGNAPPSGHDPQREEPAALKAVRGVPGATVPLDVAGYPVAPQELSLEQVHVYVRHGERTPVRVRMSDAPANIPERWDLCKTARRFRASVVSNINATNAMEEVTIRKVVEGPDGDVQFGECLLGELTDLGRQNTYNFGRALRQLYVDRLQFLPDALKASHADSSQASLQADAQNDVYFRSTNVPRTIESLHEIVFGLYPSDKCLDGYVHQIRVRNGKDENLFGNTGACKRLEVLELGFAKAAAAAWNPALEPLDDKISKYLGGNPVRVDGRPRASGIFDTIRSATANGIPVPKEFTEKSVMDVIEKAIVHEWFGGYDTEEVRRLGMGRLLADVSTKMYSKATQGAANRLRLLVHSTHDTSLAGLLKTLDVFDEKWPSFTSSVTFELFRKTSSGNVRDSTAGHESAGSLLSWQTILAPFRRPRLTDQYYVRTRYQNRSLPLPACAEDGKHLPGHPEFCTLTAFMERIKELTPVDWEGECSVGSK
ncbi:phosphoglycerate mutase-like protein [Phanerochaete sordida]|uniref:Phosphoglycerate mutase-like protein n=1 Tax=Phanerochaete sordida TaxID=48140 RepID=A0A9P3G1U5_9APHY|nr:phosphoglycerate mutase-like protein [Phanerochaete sordida]